MEFHHWLPVCGTFASQLKELDDASPAQQIARLKYLSQCRLDFIKTNALAERIENLIPGLSTDSVVECGPAVEAAKWPYNERKRSCDRDWSVSQWNRARANCVAERHLHR